LSRNRRGLPAAAEGATRHRPSRRNRCHRRRPAQERDGTAGTTVGVAIGVGSRRRRRRAGGRGDRACNHAEREPDGGSCGDERRARMTPAAAGRHRRRASVSPLVGAGALSAVQVAAAFAKPEPTRQGRSAGGKAAIRTTVEGERPRATGRVGEVRELPAASRRRRTVTGRGGSVDAARAAVSRGSARGHDGAGACVPRREDGAGRGAAVGRQRGWHCWRRTEGSI
jgi:hypothetical protein